MSENPIPESSATVLPGPEYDCPVFEWVENFGRYADSLPTLISEVGRRFQDCGLPLARLSIVIRTLHPQIAAAGFAWDGETGEMSEFRGDHQSQSSESYQRSPVRVVFEGSPGLRRRLLDPDCPRDFPILEDLASQGVTDYVILPIPFSNGQTYACSWATKAPGGFPDAAIARIAQLMPAFSLVLEILAVRMISRNLMDTYLGHSAGERVLQGEIYRGVNETIESVVWISDLRNFTRMSDEFAPPVMLGILNDHFERVVGAIADHGGEVLKFMGDSVLAIFPVDSELGPQPAVTAALSAARDATKRIGEGNNARRKKGLTEIGFGIALHHGNVVYGNIGAPDRLDFTVIGPAVNQTARIEALCRKLERPVLASQQIADASGESLVSLGFHALRGVREPQEIFTLPEHA
ncbi:MAG: adenylate/guanylate cyclase domain-containing protein [Proteobacteria bacterium]|nr:adenylate/guanylate cyclase domain-containing protein [Pseudomonadota bacterium]